MGIQLALLGRGMPGRPFEGFLSQLCGGGQCLRGQLEGGGQDSVTRGSWQGEGRHCETIRYTGKYE